MKTIEAAIRAASRCLNGVGIENARMESEFLVAACLKVPRTHLILHRKERLPADKIRAELKEYGAWDEIELADDDANLRRLIWAAANNIAEDESPDFSEPVKTP